MIIINIFNIIYRKRCKKSNIEVDNIYRTGKIKKILILTIILSGIPLLILSIPGVIQIPFTIKPQDYKVEIAFWGGYNELDDEIYETLNEHEATLVMCCYDNINEFDIWNNIYCFINHDK